MVVGIFSLGWFRKQGTIHVFIEAKEQLMFERDIQPFAFSFTEGLLTEIHVPSSWAFEFNFDRLLAIPKFAFLNLSLAVLTALTVSPVPRHFVVLWIGLLLSIPAYFSCNHYRSLRQFLLTDLCGWVNRPLPNRFRQHFCSHFHLDNVYRSKRRTGRWKKQ